MENMQPAYAGFWKRFLAMIIDGLLISVVSSIIMFPFFGALGIGMGAASEMQYNQDYQFDPNNEEVAVMLAGIFVAMLIIGGVIFVIQWLYYALMQSSSKQATLGKMALGLKVTDLNGKRISFGKATGRYFSKLISGAIMYIGYIMAAFTEKKQALHDMIAGTLVVEK